MQNCPGWAMSGGPWIKPENAMRHLIWQRIDVEGGKRVEVKFPTLAPSAPHPKDYRDVVVLAFPAIAQWGRALTPAKVSSNIKSDWDAWLEWKKSALRDSGLIGPVRVIRCRFAEIPRP